MESPLSFDASENFRKKLLSINLPPYKTKGGPSFEENVARSELILVNYSVSDSPSVEDIGEKQERVLITKNQYGPNDPSYGDTVDINKDQNFKSPEGNYNLSKTIQSQLEKNGDFQETLLYVKNIYVPTVDGQGYGVSRYDINNDLQKGNKNDVYDISDTFNNELEQVGNQQEILLKTKNTYYPSGADYGDTSYDINDDEVIDTTGFGNYIQRGLDPFWVSNNNVSVVGSVEFFDNTIKNKFRLIVPNGVEYDINYDDEGLFTTPGNGLFDSWGKKVIGITTKGGIKHTNAKGRELTQEDIEPLLKLKDYVLVSLDYSVERKLDGVKYYDFATNAFLFDCKSIMEETIRDWMRENDFIVALDDDGWLDD